MNTKQGYRFATAALSILLAGGCPADFTITLPTGDGTIDFVRSDIVRVEVFNDTDWEVDPRIRFDDDSNWFAQLIPAEELATGILAPGESLSFDIDCDELGLVYSDEAGQFLFGDDVPIGQADSTRVLTRDDDYDCGDTVLFHFLGSDDGFGVVVSVNDVVVD